MASRPPTAFSCPRCKKRLGVNATRRKAASITRYRLCRNCGHRLTTDELPRLPRIPDDLSATTIVIPSPSATE